MTLNNILLILIATIVLIKPAYWLAILAATAFLQARVINTNKVTLSVDTTESKQSVYSSKKFNVQKYIAIQGLKRYTSIKIGFIPSHLLRKFLLKYVLKMNIMDNVTIYGRGEIWEPHNIVIGKGSIIGDKAFLDGRYGIEIGEHVNMGIDVMIFTNQHDVQSPTFGCDGKHGKVTIGNRVWLGARTIILPGITVGDGAVIASGAVVTTDVEPFSIYGGIPARKIATRNTALVYEFSGEHLWFY